MKPPATPRNEAIAVELSDALGELGPDERAFVVRHATHYLRILSETPHLIRLLHALWRRGELPLGPDCLAELKRLVRAAGATRSGWSAIHHQGDRIFSVLRVPISLDNLCAYAQTAALVGQPIAADAGLVACLLDLQQRVHGRDLPQLCARLPTTAWRLLHQAFCRVNERPQALARLLRDEVPFVFSLAYGRSELNLGSWRHRPWAFWLDEARELLHMNLRGASPPALPLRIAWRELEFEQVRTRAELAKDAHALSNCLESRFRRLGCLSATRRVLFAVRRRGVLVAAAELLYLAPLGQWVLYEIAGVRNRPAPALAEALLQAICRAAAIPERGELTASDLTLSMSVVGWIYQQPDRNAARIAARFSMMVNTGRFEWVQPLLSRDSAHFDTGSTDVLRGDYLLHRWQARFSPSFAHRYSAQLGRFQSAAACLLVPVTEPNAPVPCIAFRAEDDGRLTNAHECLLEPRAWPGHCADLSPGRSPETARLC